MSTARFPSVTNSLPTDLLPMLQDDPGQLGITLRFSYN